MSEELLCKTNRYDMLKLVIIMSTLYLPEYVMMFVPIIAPEYLDLRGMNYQEIGQT
jgi:hypothetical protein